MHFLTIFLSFFLLNACNDKGSSGSSGSGTSLSIETTSGNKQSSPSTADEIAVTFFEKKYNKSKLENLIRLKDFEDGIKYLNKEGIAVYASNASAVNQYRIALAPQSLLKHFLGAAKKIEDDKQGVVAGMFISKGRTLDNGDVSPTNAIIMSDDISYATLVHEYMHYLFDVERRKLSNYRDYSNISDDMKKQINIFVKDLDLFANHSEGLFESHDNFIREDSNMYELLVVKFYDIALLIKTKVIVKFMEEAIIENILLHYEHQGDLYIPENTSYVMNTYINMNVSSAKNLINLLANPALKMASIQKSIESKRADRILEKIAKIRGAIIDELTSFNSSRL